MKTIAEKLQTATGKTELYWLGQAGFIIKSASGKLLGIDLYLSDCVESVEGHVGYHRLMPQILDSKDVVFDVLIATHYHRDHFDIDAMPELMNNGHTQLYCAHDCEQDVERLGIDSHRVQFVKPGNQIQCAGFAVDFIHSDHGAGAPLETAPIVKVDGKCILETGDTSLHIDWKEEYLKAGRLDVLIAPINGAYGNLCEHEHVELTKALCPKLTVPCHFGMFASHGGNPGLWKELMDAQLPNQQYKLFTMGEGIEI